MGLLSKAVRVAAKNRGRITRLARDNADTISGTVGKVSRQVDARTGGKHRTKLDRVEGAVEKALRDDRRGRGRRRRSPDR